MDPKTDQDRRRFLGTAAMTLAAGSLAIRGAAKAEPQTKDSGSPPAKTPGGNTSFGALKQVGAGVLNVGYAEAGPAAGQTVILLHGWPYDIHSCVEVAPLLTSKGYRVIVPHLRGYGSTRFLSSGAESLRRRRHRSGWLLIEPSRKDRGDGAAMQSESH